jgi:serine/threonine protein kinase
MVLTRIGVGGFAFVYLVVDMQQKKVLALKIAQGPLNPKDLASFIEEAERGKRLSQKHTHILPVYAVATIQGNIPYVVMAYAPNGSLRDLLQEINGPLDPAIVLQYGEQIASALQHVHTNKLVHRDIKPENILLGPRMHIWVADFGIAVASHSTQSMVLQDKTGTPVYVSPEQLQGKARTESDQYSFAFMLYELLSGIKGYDGATGYVILQHLQGPIPSLPQSVLQPQGKIPHGVNAVLMKAMAKAPRDRYQTVWKFWQAFKKEMQNMGSQPIVAPSSVPGVTMVLPQSSGPLKPQEAVHAKSQSIPPQVFEAFNEMITKHLSGGYSSFKQEDVVTLMTAKGLKSKEIYENHWLDVEDIYRKQGWKVTYDSPAYNESYPATFTFVAPAP